METVDLKSRKKCWKIVRILWKKCWCRNRWKSSKNLVKNHGKMLYMRWKLIKNHEKMLKNWWKFFINKQKVLIVVEIQQKMLKNERKLIYNIAKIVKYQQNLSNNFTNG